MRTVALAVLIAAASLVAGCGESGGGSSGTAATTAETTTAVTTTVAAPVTSSTTTTVETTAPSTAVETVPPTTIPANGVFEPACIDRGPTRPQPTATPMPDALGPLGAGPVVDLALPQLQLPDGTTEWSRTSAVAIPGGMLMWLAPYSSSADIGMIAAVDADGTVRWQRCLGWRPNQVFASATSTSGEALVMTVASTMTGGFASDWEVWSLADGTVSRTIDDVIAASGVTGDAASYRTLLYGWQLDDLLLAPEVEGNIDMSGDALLRIETSSMTASVVKMPPVPLSGMGDEIDELADGRLIALGERTSLGSRSVAAVQVGNGWTTKPAALRAARPVAVGFAFLDDGASEPLVGMDALGKELWRRPDLNAVRAEGFRTAVTGDVAVARTCGPLDPTGEDWCPSPAVVGVDALTGRTLWRFDGQYGVTLVSNGLVMMVGPFGDATATLSTWAMIDARTGELAAADQHWADPWSFAIGCCDSPESAWIDGSAVLTVDERDLQLWYPRQATTPTVRVSLG